MSHFRDRVEPGRERDRVDPVRERERERDRDMRGPVRGGRDERDNRGNRDGRDDDRRAAYIERARAMENQGRPNGRPDYIPIAHRGGGAGPAKPRPPLKRRPTVIVDREKVVPFLMRIFVAKNQNHAKADFASGQVPSSGEIQIYGWMDTTLRELVDAIKAVNDEAQKTSTLFTFSSVYPDGRGDIQMRMLGTVHSLERSGDDMMTLQELRFSIGDSLDVVLQQEERQYEERHNKMMRR